MVRTIAAAILATVLIGGIVTTDWTPPRSEREAYLRSQVRQLCLAGPRYATKSRVDACLAARELLVAEKRRLDASGR